MTTAATVRRLLVDAAGDPLCDACLAFACSVSLPEMCQVTEDLLSSVGFAQAEKCASCRRTVSAISYTAKCAHCSRPVLPGEDGLKIDGDIFHATCFWKLSSDENIHTSHELCAESRRLVEDARRQMRGQRGRRDRAASSG
jgi:hypothetical protein